MANLEQLKNDIRRDIKTNGQQAITGDLLQARMLETVDTLNGAITENTVKLGALSDKINALALGAFYGYFPDSASLPTDVTTKGYAYVGEDNPYAIWNYDGESWSDSGTTIDQNDADEEDITRNADGKLQFKDRDTTDGMGYVILRKDKTFAEQVTEDNTIYEVRYDFDLGGEEVEIPSNCILKFNGGKISNGTIIGDKTKITSEQYAIFSSSLILSGLFVTPNFYVEWYGAMGDGSTDDTIAINNSLSNAPLYSKVVLSREYKITDTILLNRDVQIECDGVVYSYSCTPAILIEGGGKKININKIEEKSATFDFIQNSNYIYNVGVLLKNSGRCNISINEIKGFNSALLIVGDHGGASYNNITLGRLDSCYNGIRVMSVNGGWANGNRFSKAVFAYHSWFIDNAEPYFIIMDSYGSTPYSNNSNIFDGIAIEFGIYQNEYPRLFKADYVNGIIINVSRVEVDRGEENEYDAINLGEHARACTFHIGFSWQKIIFNNFDNNENTITYDAVYGVQGARWYKKDISDQITSPMDGVTYSMKYAIHDVLTGKKTFKAVMRTSSTIPAGTNLFPGLPAPSKNFMSVAHILPYSLWAVDITGNVVIYANTGGRFTNQTEIPYSKAIIIEMEYY